MYHRPWLVRPSKPLLHTTCTHSPTHTCTSICVHTCSQAHSHKQTSKAAAPSCRSQTWQQQLGCWPYPIFRLCTAVPGPGLPVPSAGQISAARILGWGPLGRCGVLLQKPESTNAWCPRDPCSHCLDGKTESGARGVKPGPPACPPKVSPAPSQGPSLLPRAGPTHEDTVLTGRELRKGARGRSARRRKGQPPGLRAWQGKGARRTQVGVGVGWALSDGAGDTWPAQPALPCLPNAQLSLSASDRPVGRPAPGPALPSPPPAFSPLLPRCPR